MGAEKAIPDRPRDDHLTSVMSVVIAHVIVPGGIQNYMYKFSKSMLRSG
jgi:hypothetical protein